MIKENKKIIILVGDGMADFPIEELGWKTPLEAAETKNMDYMAKNGILGLTKTVPDGLAPGSDTANLSIFGYDPVKYFTGRASLEAINMGIDLGINDVAFRCNLVDIEDDIMIDFSAGHIETKFTKLIINELNDKIKSDGIEWHPGVSYRNIIVWRNYPYAHIPETTPPHDIQGKAVKSFLPKGDGAELLNDIMTRSQKIIHESELIMKSKTLHKGNPKAAWIWGGGRKPALDTLKERFGLHGHTISAVDLIHGIGIAAGLSPLFVEGVTGYLDTNYAGKADALLGAIEKSNFVFLHVESPDESGHEGNLAHKIKAIEDFDAIVVGRVLKGMEKFEDYVILVMPDHPTPISVRTHTADPVPFCIYGNHCIKGFQQPLSEIAGFNEKSARGTGLLIDEAFKLIDILIG